jgi:hypothetical protein
MDGFVLTPASSLSGFERTLRHPFYSIKNNSRTLGALANGTATTGFRKANEAFVGISFRLSGRLTEYLNQVEHPDCLCALGMV